MHLAWRRANFFAIFSLDSMLQRSIENCPSFPSSSSSSQLRIMLVTSLYTTSFSYLFNYSSSWEPNGFIIIWRNMRAHDRKIALLRCSYMNTWKVLRTKIKADSVSHPSHCEFHALLLPQLSRVFFSSAAFAPLLLHGNNVYAMTTRKWENVPSPCLITHSFLAEFSGLLTAMLYERWYYVTSSVNTKTRPIDSQLQAQVFSLSCEK